jgi:translation elongation factor EF-4
VARSRARSSKIEEPIIEATVITREDFIGEILKLLEEKRGSRRSSSTSAAAASCWSTNCR